MNARHRSSFDRPLILFFDTETTGTPIDRMERTHDYQPWLVQVAGLLMSGPSLDTDVVDSFSMIVRPPQVAVFHADATGKHGLDMQVCNHFGVETCVALHRFMTVLDRAFVLVAHNAVFDVDVVSREVERATSTPWIMPVPVICTMHSAAHVYTMPPTERMVATGNYSPRIPKLNEFHERFFGESFVGEHDAMADTIACARIFWWLAEHHPASLTLVGEAAR